VVAVLLCVLWVRSYWKLDALFIEHLKNVVSSRGELCFSCSISWPTTVNMTEHQFGPFTTQSLTNSDKYVQVGKSEGWAIPVWLPVLLAGALLLIPWMPWCWRFSLRTLLMATSLVAVVLGLIMWLR
jgi:hypothetical protein